MSFQLRELLPEHYEATRAIYNYYITNTNATPEMTARTAEQHEQIVSGFLSAYVACDSEQVFGFAFVKPYARGIESFDPAVEVGVYMQTGRFRRGGGSGLVRSVLTQAKRLSKHTAIAKVDADNAASIALFGRLGFRESARLHEIGFKRGVRVTVVYMQLMLSAWSSA